MEEFSGYSPIQDFSEYPPIKDLPVANLEETQQNQSRSQFCDSWLNYQISKTGVIFPKHKIT